MHLTRPLGNGTEYPKDCEYEENYSKATGDPREDTTLDVVNSTQYAHY